MVSKQSPRPKAKAKTSPEKSMMSQCDNVKHDTADVLMTDVQDESSEAQTAGSLPRLPKKLPSLPTSSEHRDQQEMEEPNSTDSKDAENIIDDLSNQLSEAREELNKIHQRARTFERDWDNLQLVYTSSESELNQLKKDYENLQKKHSVVYKNTAAQLLDVEGRKKQAEADRQFALIRVQEVSDELQKCKDELFNLQPPNQVADTHISAEWEALCSSITSWIDDQSGGIDDLRDQLFELRAQQGISEAVDEYWGEDRQLLANHYSQNSNILDELIRYNVHCLLEERVFNDRVYMVGIHPSEAETLYKIEQIMAKLEPLRDPSSIGLWRSEALVALSSDPSYGRHLEMATQRITREASEFLEPLLPRRVPGAMSAFHRDITIPAINLASTMRQSTANYRFVFRLTSNEYMEGRPPLPRPGKGSLLYKADLAEIDVLDVGSRITLKKGRAYEEAKDGSIAESILVVHPALYRKRTTESSLLSKRVVLAELLKPPQRRGQPRDVEGSRGLLDNFNFNFRS